MTGGASGCRDRTGRRAGTRGTRAARRPAPPGPARPIGRSARPAPCTGARSAPANGTAAMPEVGGGGRAGAVRRDARRYARLSGRLVLPPTMLGFTTTDSSAADTTVCSAISLLNNFSLRGRRLPPPKLDRVPLLSFLLSVSIPSLPVFPPPLLPFPTYFHTLFLHP